MRDGAVIERTRTHLHYQTNRSMTSDTSPPRSLSQQPWVARKVMRKNATRRNQMADNFVTSA